MSTNYRQALKGSKAREAMTDESVVRKEIERLSYFDESVTYFNAEYQDLIAESRDGEIFIRSKDGTIPAMEITDLAVGNLLNKSSARIVAQTYKDSKRIPRKFMDEIHQVLDQRYRDGQIGDEAYSEIEEIILLGKATPNSFDTVSEALRKAKRERDRSDYRNDHRFVVYDNKIQDVQGYDNPVNALKVSRLLSAWQNYENLQGFKEPKMRIYWDEMTGNVNAQVTYDTFTVDNARHNPLVRVGWTIRNGYYSGSGMSIRPYYENQVCTNGQTRKSDISKGSTFYAIHSNEGKVAEHLGDWLQRNHNPMRSAEWFKDDDYLIKTKVQNGYMPDVSPERFTLAQQERYYSLICETIFSAITSDAAKQKELMEKSAKIPVDDLDKALLKIRNANSSWFRQKDQEALEDIWNSDDTLPRTNATLYDVAQSISRYANTESLSAQKVENLQDLSYNLTSQKWKLYNYPMITS